eukprot:gene19466-26127_t
MEDDNHSAAMSTRSSRSSKSMSSSASTTTRRKRKAKSPPKLPQRPVFCPEHIQMGLSQLGRTSDGMRPAFLTLQIEGTDMSSTDAVAPFTHLQVLKLKRNELTDIKALRSLQSLAEIDVAQNKLTQVLGYVPVTSSTRECNVRKADFSENQIVLMSDLSAFKRLQDLYLDRNKIENISGLKNLMMLHTLSLSGNLLTSCKGLQNLAGLRFLNLENNIIESLEPLSSLAGLQVLLVKNNKLTSLEGVQSMLTLRKLDVSNNLIPGLQQISQASKAYFLEELNTIGNPMEKETAQASKACFLLELKTIGNPMEKCMIIRLHQVYMLPQVSVLNEASVSAEEKVAASNLHGADAEALRIIRKKHFPNGELDDGGGALPPTAAGLCASQAEEELGGSSNGDPGLRKAFALMDSHVKSLGVGVAITGNGGLPALSDKLASACKSSQVLLAYVCWRWVCCHVVPPKQASEALSVEAPLFGPGPEAAAAEEKLLGGTTGTWAERAAWVFIQLSRGCELEAIIIPGFWKGGRTIPPGEGLIAHNHSWSGVKVNGMWRLVDPAGAALHGGALAGALAPFFTPPSVFIFSYLPLEAHWQLIDGEPLALEQWIDLPELAVSMFSRGGRLLSDYVSSINTLDTVKEGEPLPSMEIRIAVNLAPGVAYSHTLYNSAGDVVTAWPPVDTPPLGQHLSFQQVLAGDKGVVDLEFGAEKFKSQVLQCWTTFPEPGDYWLDISSMTDLPGGLPLHVEGLSQPMVLRIIDSDEILRVKIVWGICVLAPGDYWLDMCSMADLPWGLPLHVEGLSQPTVLRIIDSDEILRVVVPEVFPHEPDDGVLHDAVNPLRVLPYAHPLFTSKKGQLISPPVDHLLESDRTEVFKVTIPGCTGAALAGPNGKIIAQLEQLEEGGCTFGSSVPRVSSLKVVGYTHQDALQACGWVPLLTFHVLDQAQHVVFDEVEPDIPSVDPSDPRASQAADMFKSMDINRDGKVTRKEMLLAFRRNRQIADFLKLPHRVRQLPDGTFDRFVEGFLAIDNEKLGTFTFDELCAHMGIVPADLLSDEESGSWEDDDECEEGEGGGERAEGGEGAGGGEGQEPVESGEKMQDAA